MSVKIESEEDLPDAIRKIAECLPDNMLLNMVKKSKDHEHDKLLKYLEEEKQKRNL